MVLPCVTVLGMAPVRPDMPLALDPMLPKVAPPAPAPPPIRLMAPFWLSRSRV